MKTKLLTVILLFPTILFASDYYWVGGAGIWSDYANHWATSSGGQTFYGQSPTPADNVYFDSNSFNAPDDTVRMDQQTVYCASLNMTGANAPILLIQELTVFGSVILNPTVKLSGQFLTLSGTSPNNIAALETDSIDLSQLAITGTGGYSLTSPMNMLLTDVEFSANTINTNNFPIEAMDFTIRGDSNMILLGRSDIFVLTDYGVVVNTHSPFVDADSASITCLNIVSGGWNNHYHYVSASGTNATGPTSCVFDKLICSDFWGVDNHITELVAGSYRASGNIVQKGIVTGGYFTGTAIFDTLIFSNPGSTINANGTTNMSINSYWLIQADAGHHTSILSTAGIANFHGPSSGLCTDYIYLQNIAVTGSASFSAGAHSFDLGGSSGWKFSSCTPSFSNVWPGDANYDLVVNNFDFLNIGVAFGDTGFLRAGASNSFTAQTCEDWAYQFNSGLNVKHADCDGNGTIDFNDTIAISQNYGMIHPARITPPSNRSSSGYKLSFQAPSDLNPGDSVSIPILFGSLNMRGYLYGFAFSINYDPAFVQPGSMSVDYNGSWLNYNSGHITFQKDFPGAGTFDVAYCRTNHTDIYGFGKIVMLHFVVAPNANGNFNLSFSDARFIMANEVEVEVNTEDQSISTGIGELTESFPVSVYPNPAHAHVTFHAWEGINDEGIITLFSISGQLLGSWKLNRNEDLIIGTEQLKPGLYFYSIHDSKDEKRSYGKLLID